MTDRIRTRFEALRRQDRAGLMTFVVAGDPGVDVSRKLIKRLPAAGADIVEIGIPAADPRLDGATIAEGHRRARASGADAWTAIEFAADLRESDPWVPIVLMGYAAEFRSLDANSFLTAIAGAGADAVLIVNATDVEEAFWARSAAHAGLAFVPIVRGQMDVAPRPTPAWVRRGFVYCVASLERTGGAPPSVAVVAATAGKAREVYKQPIMVGFGIRTQLMAGLVGKFADAVAVGTAVVRSVADHLDNGRARPDLVDGVCETVADLAEGLRTSRLTPSASKPIRGTA